MGYLIFEQVGDWARHQVDDGSPYCESCMTKMLKIGTGEGERWYCPNEMCLDDERYEVEEEE